MNVLIKKTTERAKKVGVAFNVQRKQYGNPFIISHAFLTV